MKLEERIEYLQMKKRHRRVLLPWYKKWWGISLLTAISIILVFVISFALLIIRLIKNPLEMASFLNPNYLDQITQNIEPDEFRIKLVEGPANYYLGTSTPLTTIVVFSDFTCPYCKKSAYTISELALKYEDSVKIIIRDLPVLTEGSLELALAARCAGEQGKYWTMYYQLFDKQGNFSSADLKSLAQSAGVSDLDKFSQCLSSEKYKNDVVKDFSDAQYLEVSGTPAWFIDGYSAGEGAIPTEAWSSFLDLKAKEKQEKVIE